MSNDPFALWECGCPVAYIHHSSEASCRTCGATPERSADDGGDRDMHALDADFQEFPHDE